MSRLSPIQHFPNKPLTRFPPRNSATGVQATGNASPSGKGKGKAVEEHTEGEEEDEEEDEDEEMGSDEEEEDEVSVALSLSSVSLFFHAFFMSLILLLLTSWYHFKQVEEEFEEIDPSVILPTGRRTRGVKVDYTSKEALEKAGLKGDEDDDDDDDVVMKN